VTAITDNFLCSGVKFGHTIRGRRSKASPKCDVHFPSSAFVLLPREETELWIPPVR